MGLHVSLVFIEALKHITQRTRESCNFIFGSLIKKESDFSSLVCVCHMEKIVDGFHDDSRQKIYADKNDEHRIQDDIEEDNLFRFSEGLVDGRE